MGKSNKKQSPLKKLFILIIISIIIFGGLTVYKFYAGVKEANVNIGAKNAVYIYIPTGSDYNDVKKIIYDNNLVKNKKSFEWVAEKKKYPDYIKPGRYKIEPNMSNNKFVNLLRSGKQEPVKLVFNKVRTKERFAGIIAKQLELDSTDLVKKLYDNNYLKKYGKNTETAMTLFIPNTYEVYWTTNVDKFFDRMYTEYKRFWNKSRLKKADKINMTPEQITILASIIEEETIYNKEKPIIASVYLNRLNKGMRLQACPTVKFALKDFEKKRVLIEDVKFDSPYNTYKNKGLPPGPICIPTISSIDAVLNHKNTDYLYFCAKDDFSGYNIFAKTLKQHNKNAKKYQNALNRSGIYR